VGWPRRWHCVRFVRDAIPGSPGEHVKTDASKGAQSDLPSTVELAEQTLASEDVDVPVLGRGGELYSGHRALGKRWSARLATSGTSCVIFQAWDW
jgi:hypothetical protein